MAIYFILLLIKDLLKTKLVRALNYAVVAFLNATSIAVSSFAKYILE